ncbi:MAG: Hpt domain-containing protein [Oceanicoccus sp.]|uniref:Hpt domain-containing protein n=1 Tax=Oceanicoccus sp. TaxID=2691044 RepID=UPI00262CD9CF|nr:Hpt domain-containing protein [Oceanicoccus sp.]MCP3908117.1 Hpt domain-containing protein [Oceanicoccus sp.]MDG1771933.1 Hpt domain-containing protein [Oceanicoccus sp.]
MSDAHQHLDLDALKELQLVMGEEFSLLAKTFISDSSLRLEGIREAIAAQNPEAIRRAAHGFKGSSSNMAAPKLTHLCRSLEELGYNGCTEGSEQLEQDIIAEYEQVKQALEAFL